VNRIALWVVCFSIVVAWCVGATFGSVASKTRTAKLEQESERASIQAELEKNEEDKKIINNLSLVANVEFYRVNGETSFILNLPIKEIMNWEPNEQYWCVFHHAKKSYDIIIKSPSFDGSPETLTVYFDFREGVSYGEHLATVYAPLVFPNTSIALTQPRYSVTAYFESGNDTPTSKAISCELMPPDETP
jgi:hypothetical protein